MPIELTWKHNDRLSAIHLAYCSTCFSEKAYFRLPECRIQASLLGGAVKSLVVPASRAWELLFQLGPDSGTNDDLANRLCVRCLRVEERTEPVIGRLRSALREAELAMANEYPDFAEETKLRQRPLQEQWEAFGPGLLHQIGKLMNNSLLVEKAEICLVPPVSGGFGWAHLQTNRCHVEAVLINQDRELAEVIRLAWLLSQLDFERPQFSDKINSFRLRRVAGLAMLPAVLAAAEILGLAVLNTESILRGLVLWRMESPGSKALALAEVLMAWWETVCTAQANWTVALTGLDRLAAD